jgi:hypothetical protein
MASLCHDAKLGEVEAYRRFGAVLDALGKAESAGTRLDVAGVARELELAPDELAKCVELIEACGLAAGGGADDPPLLRHAGREFLARRGMLADEATLAFLPWIVDNLDVRRALLCAGAKLTGDLRDAVLDGDAVEHVRGLIGDRGGEAVNERVALAFYAALVALTTRLGYHDPPACAAEGMLMVALVDAAVAWLRVEADAGVLDAEELAAAIAELDALLPKLVQLAPFAAGEHGGPRDEPGRHQSWFVPFAGAPGTTYLAGPAAG